MLYGLYTLYHDSKMCFESGYFQTGHPYTNWILESIKAINLELRPQIINIIEACYPNSDGFIVSAVGNYYGDIYEQHLKWAQGNDLNKTEAGDSIPDGFLEYMTPIIKAKL